jgi:hypothetical protein
MKWQSQGTRLDNIQQGKQDWSKPLFMEIFMIGAWHIWRERNNLVFNGVSPSLDNWKRGITNDLNLLVHRTKQQLHLFISSVVGSI